MTYTLIEPCAGSAAFSLHLMGSRRALLPYQGSKWRFRHGLTEMAESLGFAGPPSRVVLTDPGPWGRTLNVVLDRKGRAEVLQQLIEIEATEDPQDAFNRLQGAPIPADDATFAAQHLFLQRLAFSGKAVGTTADGRWSSPGFNPTSAYGTPATSRFGKVNPMIPSLIRMLKGMDQHMHAAPLVEVRQQAASPPGGVITHPTLVYLDPPYAESTRYPDGEMSREEVAELATRWAYTGAAVMVSEQHPLPLTRWHRQKLYRGRRDSSPFRGKQAEWVTYTPAIPTITWQASRQVVPAAM